ncbi:unnamed protein product [Durusdinium trenchii]|uniref:Integrase catalytic domain-containing protein n=1 Tax=Durusdinium trenchii TaxID=1381693 RepID=A0ABP0QGY6_9DINO
MPSQSTKQPPSWLANWRTFLLRLLMIEFNVLKAMRKLVKIGLRPRAWLSSTGLADLMEKQRRELHRPRAPAKTCTHPEFKRYGNAHGQFSQCKRCDQKFRWIPDQEAWAVYSPKSSSSSALPLPSSATILAPTDIAKPKSRPSKHTAYKSKARPMRPSSDAMSVQSAGSSALPITYRMTEEEIFATGLTKEELDEAMYTGNLHLYDSDNPDGYPSDMESWDWSPSFRLTAAQPVDYKTGWDLNNTRHQADLEDMLDSLRPLVLIQGIDCRDWSILQDNTNYIRRKILLLAKARKLLKKVTSWCHKQAEAGRLFLLENPTTSRLWQEEAIKKLEGLPNVSSITCHAGAYGAVNSQGQMIRKGHRFMGNCPHVLKRLGRHLSAEEQRRCVPQHYPHQMVTEILKGVQDEVRARFPDRFQPGPKVYRSYMETYSMVSHGASSDSTTTNHVALSLARATHTHRAAALQYNDGEVQIIEEDLSELRHPKARFKKPVQLAIFMFGQGQPDAERPRDRISASHEAAQPPPSENDLRKLVPPPPGDEISFPSELKIPAEIKNAIRRMHQNLGHPKPAELKKLLALNGVNNQAIYTAVEHLRCNSCERTKGPSRPDLGAIPAEDGCSQFGDRLQMDIFYVRDVTGQNFMVLGIIDEVTHLHLAALLDNRQPETVLTAFNDTWAKAFGYPLRIRLDPDGSFRSHFEDGLDQAGVFIDYVPAEAHNKIGLIERHDAVFRSLMERIIDHRAITGREQMYYTTTAAAFAKNSCTWSAGRPPYVAAFSRIPRMGIERALLRNTATSSTDTPEVGSIVAYWRWTARSGKKHGGYKLARLLGRDPDGKSMWLQAGTNTVRVAPHQLRVARGFECWHPDYQQIKDLRAASANLHDNQLQDERVPEPPDDPDQPLGFDGMDPAEEIPPSAAEVIDIDNLPDTPQPAEHLEHVVPSTPPDLAQDNRQSSKRSSTEMAPPLSEQAPPAPLGYKAPLAKHTQPRQIGQNTFHLKGYNRIAKAATQAEPSLLVWARLDTNSNSLQTTHLSGPPKGHIKHRRVLTYPQGSIVWDAPYEDDQTGRRISPEYTTLVTELWHEHYAPHPLDSLEVTPDGIQQREHHHDGSDHISMPYSCHTALHAYRKAPGYNGTGESSDSEASADDMTAGHRGNSSLPTTAAARSLTRQEQKALGKEVPWQAIKYVESAKAEEASWQQFDSVIPLTVQEANKVHQDPILRRRIPKARAAYRDNAKGQGPLKAKTRVVALGHLDPDLQEICRESATASLLHQRL